MNSRFLRFDIVKTLEMKNLMADRYLKKINNTISYIICDDIKHRKGQMKYRLTAGEKNYEFSNEKKICGR